MKDAKLNAFLKGLIENMPNDWLRLTTHRLDIYDESQAKYQFLEELEKLYQSGDSSESALAALPTAFDYIRLGHPLSSVLEWALAKENSVPADQIIAFSSQTAPLMAVMRKNLLDGVNTRIITNEDINQYFHFGNFGDVYQYNAEIEQFNGFDSIDPFDGSTVFFSKEDMSSFRSTSEIDFIINVDERYGSIILVSNDNSSYVSEIQHVRRRETIAMTPADCNTVLRRIVGLPAEDFDISKVENNEEIVSRNIKNITGSDTNPLVGSSGLSIQYGIMMGLVHNALDNHPGKDIKFIVPPNCYGGTNDQARRVAACIPNVDVLDLPVDAGRDMVSSVEQVLGEVAQDDAVPYIIVEIPTNPRVEVPDLIKLEAALSKERTTSEGEKAVAPVFVLDQTFCPNYHFLGDDAILANVQTIAYVSGSKFPSGGLCTAGYVTSNAKARSFMLDIEQHMMACDNFATHLQMDILAKQLPSMLDRIAGAYENTREFVDFISEKLPEAKINFVSEELAAQGFTPSVFSLDLPTKGNTDEEREMYKRELNLKLINMMIESIPEESKYCVSYGQLKGCYWTIPATSTQGTTKEGDKDYIARVALSQNMDLEKHKEVFAEFVAGL